MISVDDFGFCAEVRLKCINRKGAKTQGVAYTEYVYDAQLRVSFSIKELVGSGATALPGGRSYYSRLKCIYRKGGKTQDVAYNEYVCDA